ncbi:MAG TPA: hypothetical protein P5121_34545 [Caldilineaceae bacterium]|nr:hypothetical protein [Caldilineaceae bacterium]
MSHTIPERLFNLLPELYRWRDRQQGQRLGTPERGPLQSFLSILEQELHTLEVDMEAMYDNWFIQTCDNWVVPYIADLLGIDDDIVNIDYLPFTQRRRVANTLAYRRRKGVVAILEQVLWDVTNWHIHAVEFYQLLAAAQHQQHLRPTPTATINIKNPSLLALLDTPFAQTGRTLEVRKMKPLTANDEDGFANDPMHSADQRFIGGKYQRDNIGLYFWRLRPYPVDRGRAHRLGKDPATEDQCCKDQCCKKKIADNCFTFHAMGRDRLLFNRPQSFQALTQSAGPVHMPIQLSRAILAADLAEYRAKHGAAQQQRDLPADSTYYGPNRSIQITILGRYLFDLPATTVDSLNNDQPDGALSAEFCKNHSALPAAAAGSPGEPAVQIIVLEAGQRWQVLDNVADIVYTVERYEADDDTNGASSGDGNSEQYQTTDTGQHETRFRVTREERPIWPAEVLSVNLESIAPTEMAPEEMVPGGLPAGDGTAAQSTTDLAHWHHYAAARNHMMVAIDPHLGRFAFLNATPHFTADDLRVDYTYGFSSDIGGGPYPRHFQLDATWQEYCEILVATGATDSPIEVITPEGAVVAASSLSHAFQLWNTYCNAAIQAGNKPRGVIRLLDNGYYSFADDADVQSGPARLWLPPTADLALVAEDGVQPTIVGRNGKFTIAFEQEVLLDAAAVADPMIERLASDTSNEVDTAQPGLPAVDRKLQISGIGVQGSLVIASVQNPEARQTLTAVDLLIEHCTILGGGIKVKLTEQEAEALSLQVRSSITGAIDAPVTVNALQIADSIVDVRLSQLRLVDGLWSQAGDTAQRNAITGPPMTIERSTIFGEVSVHAPLQAYSVLFTDPIKVESVLSLTDQKDNKDPKDNGGSKDDEKDNTDLGFLRFCYIPAGSQIPPCDHCLHECETSETCQSCQGQIAQPQFTSQSDEDPGYAQLNKTCAVEIKRGMGGIAEIGAFTHLYQPQREANIQRMLDEYLPLGLHAGIFYVS